MPHATGSLLEALSDAVGPAHVLSDPEVTASYATDWTGRFAGRAHLVALPGTTHEVVAVLAACAAHGVAVVPQGGNTGLVRASIPREGELLLSLTRLTASARSTARRSRSSRARASRSRACRSTRAPRGSTPASTSARATRRPSAGPWRRTREARGRCATARPVRGSRASRRCRAGRGKRLGGLLKDNAA